MKDAGVHPSARVAIPAFMRAPLARCPLTISGRARAGNDFALKALNGGTKRSGRGTKCVG
jgi:hypothetical protein